MKRRVLSVFTALAMICGLFGFVPDVKVNAEGSIEAAVQWAIDRANDNSCGYSQAANLRWGPDYYDCSSFVITALKNAGFNVGNATYTGNMRSNLTANGFVWIPWSSIGGVENLKRGDILLNEVEHTEFYIGNNQNVGAHTSKRPWNDQVSVSGYYNHPWDGVLRCNITSPPHNWYDDLTPANFGDVFYAKIKNQYTGWYFTAESGNVIAKEATDSDNQIWKFECQSNGSYKIINIGDGGVMDTDNYAENGNGTNIKMCGDNGESAQRYYIYSIYGAYYIRPLCTDLVVDMNSTNGNVEVWGVGEDWNPQKFEIEKIDLFGNLPINIGDDFYAKIKNQHTGWYFTAENGNVIAKNATDSDNQIWKFDRRPNGSYKIINKCDGGAMDVYNYASDGNGTNVQTWLDSGVSAQQYYIYSAYGAYYIKPLCADLFIDMNLSDGNVEVWGAGKDWKPQKFDIEKICLHTFSNWTIEKNPTTSETGVKVRKCTKCGTEERENIPKLTTTVTTKATTTTTKTTTTKPTTTTTKPITATASTTTAVLPTLPGDVNGNGKVNISDIVMLQQFLTKKDDMTSPDNADLNGDGKINVFDLIIIKRMILNFILSRR